MSINTKNLEESFELLLKETRDFKQQLQSLNECEEYQRNLYEKKQNDENNDEENISKQKKLQEKETEFDQINELYLRNRFITENERKMIDVIKNFQNQISEIIEQVEIKKKEYIEQSNKLLIDMKKIEKNIKRYKYTKEYNRNNYKNLLIETEKLKTMKEEKIEKKQISSRYKIVDNCLTEKEMTLIE